MRVLCNLIGTRKNCTVDREGPENAFGGAAALNGQTAGILRDQFSVMANV